jgi:C4-dicarboxylate-specific signal transduction histidine kinase
MLKDISHRKAQEAKMKGLNEQLVQSEKLASIGQLSAGVAHEINNPVGFVKSNINILADYFTSFEEFIDTVSQIKGHAEDTKLNLELAKITELKESLEIEYLIEDSKDIFTTSKEGLERVCKIVEEMKAFSHVEKEEQEEQNLANLVDQAISLTANEVKYKADIVISYDELPMVKCWKSKLLQVLINLLVNASHAMEERGCIRIRVYQKESFAMIDILDDGCGISEENLANIFTPFFTTKPVGEGTGLGLHVTQSIMAKHGGEISVKSKVGTGTCFKLSLPLKGVLVESE